MALVFTSRSHHSATFSTHVVHESSCPHAKRSDASADFARIPNLAIKAAVGSVRACKDCDPHFAVVAGVMVEFPKEPS